MKSANIATTDFNRMIDCTKTFLTKTKTNRPHNKFIRLEFSKTDSRVTAIACDGYRMSVEHCMASDIEEDFVACVKPTFSLPAGKIAEITLTDDGNRCQIFCEGVYFGFDQPETKGFDTWRNVQGLSRKPVFRIGFNGTYLMQALKAAQRSAGGFKEPVILEFTDPVSPVIFRTNRDDIKLVLPVRIKGDWVPLGFAEKQEDAPEEVTDNE